MVITVFDLSEKKFILFIFKQIFLLVNLFVLSSSFASTKEHLGIEKLVSQADVIAIGQYKNVSSDWQNKKVYTSATFEVSNVIKGESLKTVIIKVQGGTAVHPRLNSPITMKVQNGAEFSEGEKAIVFLKKNKDTFQIVGMSKGSITILIDDEGKEYVSDGVKKISSRIDEGHTIVDSNIMYVDEFVQFLEGLVDQLKNQ